MSLPFKRWFVAQAPEEALAAARKVYDDRFHKIRPDMGFDEWQQAFLAGYNAALQRKEQPTLAWAVRSVSSRYLGLFSSQGHAEQMLNDKATPVDAEMVELLPGVIRKRISP